MLIVVQKLANRISCPKCSSSQTLAVGLLCEQGAGACRTICSCQNCGISMLVQESDDPSLNFKSDAADSSQHRLICNEVSLSCEILPLEKTA